LTYTPEIGYTYVLMPITAQAEKKLRHDRKRTRVTKKRGANLRATIKLMRKKPSKKALSESFKTLDKAVKTHLIHKNKANRLKSRLSKLIVK
jgi:small subunit ribosomal protein S20